MVMVNNQIQVHTNLIDNSDVAFFKGIGKFSLIDKFLKWIQIKCQSLILSYNW